MIRRISLLFIASALGAYAQNFNTSQFYYMSDASTGVNQVLTVVLTNGAPSFTFTAPSGGAGQQWYLYNVPGTTRWAMINRLLGFSYSITATAPDVVAMAPSGQYGAGNSWIFQQQSGGSFNGAYRLSNDATGPGVYFDHGTMTMGTRSSQYWTFTAAGAIPYVTLPTTSVQLSTTRSGLLMSMAGGVLGTVFAGTTTNDTQWLLELVGNTPYPYYRIRNRQTNQYLHMENGYIEAGTLQPALLTMMWYPEYVTNTTVRWINRSRNVALYMPDQTIGTALEPPLDPAIPEFTRFQWAITAPTDCTYSLDGLPDFRVPSAGAASTTISVYAPNNCAWTSTSNVPWITALTTSGTGTAQARVSIAPNISGVARAGTTTTAGLTVTFLQSACAFGITPTSTNVAATAGTSATLLTVAAGCPWDAISNASWITVTTAARGTGSAAVSLAIQANTSPSPRVGTVTIGFQTYTVTQAGTGSQTSLSGLRLVTMDPCRVMETRAEYNFQGRTGAFGPPYLRTNETRTLNLPLSTICSIPARAQAYLLNVTLIPKAGVDFVTISPSGEARPNFWTVRSPDAQIVANSAIVKAGINGGIDVYASNDTDILVDIAGYYTDDPAVQSSTYYPLTPCRVVDTRADYRSPAGPFGPPSLNAREARRFALPGNPYCQLPANATAYSVTLTIVPQAVLQYLTAWPAAAVQPNVSSINSPAGRVLANSVVLPAGSAGGIDVFAFDTSDLLMDINGYYAPDNGSGLTYYPVTQCRITDPLPTYEATATRSIDVPNSPGCTGIPATAKAYAVNVTAIPNGAPMPFLTVYPTGQVRPNASVLNSFQGQTVTNSAIIPAGRNGMIDVFAFGRTDVVVEIAGYFDVAPQRRPR